MKMPDHVPFLEARHIRLRGHLATRYAMDLSQWHFAVFGTEPDMATSDMKRALLVACRRQWCCADIFTGAEPFSSPPERHASAWNQYIAGLGYTEKVRGSWKR